MSTQFDSIHLANLIISRGVDWDNSKVPVNCLETEPLADIILPYLPLDQNRVLGAWDLAVYKAHGAATDFRKTPMAIKNPLAYAIQIFRKNLGILKELDRAKQLVAEAKPMICYESAKLKETD